MSLTDKVAEFIYKSHKEMAVQIKGITTKELYSKTKDGFIHDNPRNSVQFQLSVRVGDLYRPNTICAVTFGTESVLLMPFERYLIYSLSSESNQYDMLSVLRTDNNSPEVKSIILKYDITDSDGNINVEDIKGIFCTIYPVSIFSLLENCKLVGNLKHLIT